MYCLLYKIDYVLSVEDLADIMPASSSICPHIQPLTYCTAFHEIWVLEIYTKIIWIHLTLSLPMSCIYGAPSKARNLTYIYIYIWKSFFTGDFAS
jgi:hypothetical protein